MATSVDAKLLKSTKFPPEFNQKVDMQKVRTEVVKKYASFKWNCALREANLERLTGGLRAGYLTFLVMKTMLS
jgi:hypothetical protein